VTTVIILARGMGLDVIIEGIETQEQLAFFEKQGRFQMQGYLFCQPVPAGDITKMLLNGAGHIARI